MNYFAINGNYEAAETFLDNLIEKGIKPNQIIYNNLLLAYVMKNNYDGVDRVVSLFDTNNLNFDITSYNYYIKSLLQREDT